MSFLRDYSIYTDGNECPKLFHTWAGISTLSSLCSFRISTNQGAFILRPNLYILFVGNPGIKKTTALSFSERILERIPDIPKSPPAITKQALTELLGKKESPCLKSYLHNGQPRRYTHLTLYCSELVSLLNAGNDAVSMIEFLTEIWDRGERGYTVQTKGRGTDTIIGPYITICGCLTPETMENLMFQRIISGGFTRRCIFVHADRNEKPVPRPKMTPEQGAAFERLVETGVRLQSLSGEFQWTDEAIKIHDEWYCENFKLRETAIEDPVMRGYYNSKAEFAIKIAMLLAISETEELVFLPGHFQAALTFLEQIEPGIRSIFSGSGRNQLGQVQAAIETLILNAPQPLKLKQIYRDFRNSAPLKELTDILAHLQKAGIIEVFQITVKAGIPPEDLVGRPGSGEELKKSLQQRVDGRAT